MQNIELVRPLITQSLFSTVATKELTDFKHWISSGKYLVRDLPNTKTILIEANNDNAFSTMLAFDICRTATAAFETMENIQANKNLPKSYGWIAIKCYYAAFFSAHSIMRCFGYTCSQLERGHIQIIHDYYSTVGSSNNLKIEGGYFCGEYNVGNRSLNLTKMVGNTHEETWGLFIKCLENLSRNILGVKGVTSDKQKLSSDIDGVISALKDRGRLPKGNYLSQFRNAINYRQEYCAWHPYGKTAIQTEKVLNMVGKWKQEIVLTSSIWKESPDAYNFFHTSVNLVNLCQHLMRLMHKNCDSKSNLFSRWPNKFIQTSK